MSKADGDGNSRRAGYGLFSIIGILLIALKLIGVAPVASWSWWWVLSPFLIIIGFRLLILIILIITFIISCIK